MQYPRYCTVCNSINLDCRFNLMVIKLTPHIRNVSDLHDSHTHTHTHTLSLSLSLSRAPMAKSPSLLLATKSHITTTGGAF